MTTLAKSPLLVHLCDLGQIALLLRSLAVIGGMDTVPGWTCSQGWSVRHSHTAALEQVRNSNGAQGCGSFLAYITC